MSMQKIHIYSSHLHNG